MPIGEKDAVERRDAEHVAPELELDEIVVTEVDARHGADAVQGLHAVADPQRLHRDGHSAFHPDGRSKGEAPAGLADGRAVVHRRAILLRLLLRSLISLCDDAIGRLVCLGLRHRLARRLLVRFPSSPADRSALDWAFSPPKSDAGTAPLPRFLLYMRSFWRLLTVWCSVPAAPPANRTQSAGPREMMPFAAAS